MEEDLAGPEAMLALYADGPARLDAVLHGLSESALDQALTAETWTIRQIVHHIADGDDLWKTCIKAALGNPDGVFDMQWYQDRPQTEWAARWRYAYRPVGPSLARFRADRASIVELVQQTPNAWEQSILVRTSEGGEERVSVGEVLEGQATHAAGHVRDIQAIRAQLG